MLEIADAIDRFRKAPTAGHPQNPFRLVSSLPSPATMQEIEAAWPSPPPAEVAALWLSCRAARLFEDEDYGQWGLVLLDPQACRARTESERAARAQDLRGDDIVLGEFRGDQELLVLCPSEDGPRRVLIALPLDPRSEWRGAGGGLAEFLERYFATGGEKYWESCSRGEM